MLPSAQPTCFLIADISGYTAYLAGVELDHAQDILSDLIGTVVSALRPSFRLSKIEGDAAFTYATVDRIDGSMLLDTIESCYFGLRRRRRDVRQATTCGCNACSRIPDLDLKFVVHHGPAILQEVAGRRELIGMDAIVVHRLLKNEVVESLGMSATPSSARNASTCPTSTPRPWGCDSTSRPTTRSARCRPGRTTWGAAGKKKGPASGSGSPPRRRSSTCRCRQAPRHRWHGSSSPNPVSG